jgi:hypothetical protein
VPGPRNRHRSWGWQRRTAVAATACALAAGLSAAAGAEVADTPDAATWVADGPVYAVARSSDRTFIGGDFSHVGPRTGSGVQIATDTGRLSPAAGSVPEVSGGRVMAAARARDGSWYIGGDFARIGNAPVSRVARLVPGSSGELVVDSAFDPRPSGPIHALAIGAIEGKDDHVLYIGGEFGALDGDLTYRNLAAVDRRTGQPATTMATPDDRVTSIDVLRPGDTGVSLPIVFVGGDFSAPRSRLAAIWGVGADGLLAGTVTAFTATTAAGLKAVHVGTAVKNAAGDRVGAAVYTGGGFGLQTHKFDIRPSDNNIASSTYNSLDSAVACADGSCAPSVRAISTSADGAALYAGGRFTTIFAADRANLVAVNPATNVYAATPTAVRPWKPEPDGYVHALAPSSDPAGLVYLGGDFAGVRDASEDAQVSRLGLAAVSSSVSPDTDDAEIVAWDPRATGGTPGPDAGVVTALAAGPAALYAGGSFTSIGAHPHANVAALGPSGAPVDDWTPSADAPVRALAAGNGRVYLGGDFDSVSGETRRRLAAVSTSGTGAVDSAFQPAAEPACDGPGCAGVLSVALRDRTLYVGGTFASLAGVPRRNAGAVDALTGAPVEAWAPNPDGSVYSLLATCGTVYAGGGFSTVAGLPRKRIAALDPDTAAATPWNPSVDGGTVYALARDADVVYAGGNFTEVGGTQRRRLAALDAATGRASSWNPTVPGIGDEVRAIAAPPGGSVVYAGGRFATAGRADRLSLAAFDRGAGDATSWNPGVAGTVHALASDGASLLVGGEFRRIGPSMQHGFGSFGLGSGTGEQALRCSVPPPPPPPPAPEPPAPPPPPPATRPAPPVRDSVAPQLTGVAFTNRRFRTRRRRARSAGRKRARVGTKVAYTLSEPAVVRLAFKRRARVRCAAPKTKQACYRWRDAGALRHLSGAGAAKLRFRGKVGRKSLRPGSYRAWVRAVDAAGNRSKATRLAFVVVNP